MVVALLVLVTILSLASALSSLAALTEVLLLAAARVVQALLRTELSLCGGKSPPAAGQSWAEDRGLGPHQWRGMVAVASSRWSSAGPGGGKISVFLLVHPRSPLAAARLAKRLRPAQTRLLEKLPVGLIRAVTALLAAPTVEEGPQPRRAMA